MAQSMFGHNVGVWIGVNDRQIENTYINSDGSGVDWLNWNDGVREVFLVHVGGTRCVTSSTDHNLKIHACITLTVEFIRTSIY